jgi:hypothetical protein
MTPTRSGGRQGSCPGLGLLADHDGDVGVQVDAADGVAPMTSAQCVPSDSGARRMSAVPGWRQSLAVFSTLRRSWTGAGLSRAAQR